LSLICIRIKVSVFNEDLPQSFKKLRRGLFYLPFDQCHLTVIERLNMGSSQAFKGTVEEVMGSP
jgi:hypothetical protein